MRWRAVRLHIVSRRRSCIVSKWLNTSSNYFQRQEASRSLCATAELLVSCPSHVGILGNEKASAAAKSALSLPVTPMKLPATDMYLRITKMIFDEWQEVCGIAAPEINCMLLDLTSNNLLNPHQSAYCKHHSTETALLYIHTITLLMQKAHVKFHVSAFLIYRLPSIPLTTIYYSLVCHLGSAFKALL